MDTVKLHKRSQVIVSQCDHAFERSNQRNATDAIGRAALITYQLLKDEELKSGDILTVDVRVLIEHEK